MPRYRHPSAGDGPGVPPAAVHVSRGEAAPVDESGVFEAPQRVAQAIADHHDTTVAAMRVDGDGGPDTCEVVKSDGEVCGRELPCPYHSEDT